MFAVLVLLRTNKRKLKEGSIGKVGSLVFAVLVLLRTNKRKFKVGSSLKEYKVVIVAEEEMSAKEVPVKKADVKVLKFSHHGKKRNVV